MTNAAAAVTEMSRFGVGNVFGKGHTSCCNDDRMEPFLSTVTSLWWLARSCRRQTVLMAGLLSGDEGSFGSDIARRGVAVGVAGHGCGGTVGGSSRRGGGSDG